MAQQIIFRNGTAASWTTTNPVLALGELGLESNTGQFKVGDGSTAWNSLAYTSVAGSTQTRPYRSFGDGSDGDVTISSGTTVLTRDVYYNNLIISGTGRIFTNGYKIFVKNILDLSNAPQRAINADGENGGHATGSTPGTAPTVHAAGSVASPGQGIAGAVGTTGTGASSSFVSSINGNGGPSNTAGAGGAGVNAGAGGGGAGSSGGVTLPNNINTYATNFFTGAALLGGGGGGRGGSSGGGDGINSGGAGGAGGNGGSVVAIYANIIVTSNLTPSSVISATGGNGGRGGTPIAGICGGGGGGSGGGGGWVYICYNKRAGPKITAMINASGGAGGAGGNGSGTLTSGFPAEGGGSGQGGIGGRITVHNVPFSLGTSIFPASSTIYIPEVLRPVTAQVDGIGKTGGLPGPLFLDF